MARAQAQRPEIHHCILWVAACLVLLITPGWVLGQSTEDCMMCHEDPDLTGERGGREVSVFVDGAAFASSVHAGFGCVDCHGDLDGVELPHEEELEAVDCAMCHDDMAEQLAEGPHGKWATDSVSPAAACIRCHGTHDVLSSSDDSAPTHRDQSGAICEGCHKKAVRTVRGSVHKEQNAACVDCHTGHEVQAPKKDTAQIQVCGTCHESEATEHGRSLHGRAAAQGDAQAPTCVTCHGFHGVLSRMDDRSRTSTMQIPNLCGTCHHEGSEVSIQHDIPQDRIFENYSQSIHGEGLFMKGLSVTAVCTSCHTSHFILEHTDPASSIHRDNVARTCMTCHSRIEEVHVKVIEGRLWEEEPHKIPSCVECHEPHKVRRTPLEPRGAASRDCMKCHSDPNLSMERDGQQVSLFVDSEEFGLAAHNSVACAQCHTDVVPNHDERACATIRNPVDCGICHAEVKEQYTTSLHGLLAAEGDPDAPSCLDCHDKHMTQSHRLPTSPTYARNVPDLCARCHRQGEAAARRMETTPPDIVHSYTMSIHGKGLVESGLVVSATCTDCHTAHHPQGADEPGSTVHPDNIAKTCGSCHHGIEETFRTSVHWPENTDTDKQLPSCEDCHSSHTISRTDSEGFRFTMMDQCGRCHGDEAATFFDTYHGKVSRLGSEGAAKCYDCHGTHEILPTSNPDSRLSTRNVVETCAQCHPRAHLQFAGYLSHATHHDPEKYPFLFYSFWFMTVLLVSTMTFAMLHTGAWLWRLLRTRDQWVQHKTAAKERLYQRFSRKQRLMHLVMLLSFFTLALTGMALKFSYMSWAQLLSTVLGGFGVMGILHRMGAVVLMGLFAFHLYDAFKIKKDSGVSWLKFIFGPTSMMFNLTDIRQVFQSIKWFFGRGPRPHYGRFTYWEKFDYFAVFWGVFVIGSTGLILWFPVFFTRLLPGWSVNVATIVHSDEALLAVAFIFTIHFFNTHFRPDKFPMDPVIFTGRVPLEELRHDKPAEYEQLVESTSIEEIEAALVGPISSRWERVIRFFGFTALGIGLTLVALIVYSMLFGYR